MFQTRLALRPLVRQIRCAVGSGPGGALVLAARSLVRQIRRAVSSGPGGVLLDPSLFDGSQIDAETKAATEAALAAAATQPRACDLTPQAARERRRLQYMADHVAHFGSAARPACREDRTISHPCSASPVDVSIFRPGGAAAARGVYLHMHGGGWYLGGAAFQNDVRLARLADDLRVAIVSVDYRLAPEHPWPAAFDDCLAAACWLAERAEPELGCRALVIGGESAGAQLCAATLLALRGALGLAADAALPYRAANLVYGCYDLRGTPSVRAFGARRLVFDRDEFEWCSALYLGPARAAERDRADAAVSPLLADTDALRGMPRALFSIGTDDPLLDDSLFMAARWASAGNEAELAVYPGGAHGVGHFGPHAKTSLGRRCHRRIEEFLDAHLS